MAEKVNRFVAASNGKSEATGRFLSTQGVAQRRQREPLVPLQQPVREKRSRRR